MVFGTPTQNRLHSTSVWSINQNTLENVNKYCYLGITLHVSGNFKQAQKKYMQKHYTPIIVYLNFFQMLKMP